MADIAFRRELGAELSLPSSEQRGGVDWEIVAVYATAPLWRAGFVKVPVESRTKGRIRLHSFVRIAARRFAFPLLAIFALLGLIPGITSKLLSDATLDVLWIGPLLLGLILGLMGVLSFLIRVPPYYPEITSSGWIVMRGLHPETARMLAQANPAVIVALTLTS